MKGPKLNDKLDIATLKPCLLRMVEGKFSF